MMLDLAKLQIPSIAAVHGPAHAAGCQLVATCDLAVAGQSATFATSGIKLGLFCSTPAIALVRAIGLRAAKEMLFTGHSIDAKRAYELGLVHRVVADERVFEASLELAGEISQHSRPVICMGKRGLTAQASMDISDAYDVATQVMLHNLELEDTQKGIKSFVNKQPLPVWTHKSD
ncbi:Enoyl-CoA hydratase domain-containing protein 3 mitochondrial [Paragonimus heterotremus]|uniref:Enoyl-CoA hydratase domain-containing protein 3, mitochondrial n=1 Tax=Paragonimus heterotremus TaxID=100268 RepID=A0A8J4SGX3_9TREM|nr:Enoyl-CoA hydratase domain-containing protein 3 mitochondrial [Paragonimus heterotremus]